MVALQLANQARTLTLSNPVARLYRSIAKELPRVMTIYDIDIPLPEARDAVREHFRKNGHVKDDRVVSMLIETGYMDLEEALLQHKQRSHLVRVFTGTVDDVGTYRKSPGPDASIDEQFARN
eukprot:CAMPEP_0185723110 /NCGR_PEP_ID=MMETSP1171-20130828/55_1 /TAXON_ID=374046 /ORGANISM="Helicotheca tamensis, Strain CCMP826" /LENGTH=121 /DNA_ID=CAMNT_0028390773 /DNA_START=56 /DNA_END=421 /DNA_ORIENTATION=+